jgi:hypothetical protein
VKAQILIIVRLRQYGRRIPMIDVCKKFLYMALASLVFVGLTGICLAEPNQTDNVDGSRERMNPERGYGMMNQNAGLPMGVPVDVVYSGHGFALRGNESHILRLKVENILPLEPGQIRGLLASNKSLEEIRNDIQAKEGEETYRGSVILDHSIYPLIEIAIIGKDNTTSVNAYLADIDLLSAADGTTTLGSISVTVSPSDGGMIGRGELNLGSGPQAGNYSVLLDMEPPRHENGHGPGTADMSQ